MKSLHSWERFGGVFGVHGFCWVAVLTGLVSALGVSAAQAGPVGLWQFESSGGTSLLLTPNEVPGGAPGVLTNGAQIVYDSDRGSNVVETDGTDDYVRAGAIVRLLQSATDFTWAFWAKQNPSQPVNSDVILGNRYSLSGGTDYFIKFTPNQFEYYHNGVNDRIDYPNIASDNVWHHHAVVKKGNTLSYYWDGVLQGTSTVTADMQAMPFYIGGDRYGEQWQGRIDDVFLATQALTPAELQQVKAGNFAPFVSPPQFPLIHDTFPGPTINNLTWNVIEKGLEQEGPGTAGTIQASINSDGQLVISGTANTNYWGGITLRSAQTFPRDQRTVFAVERISLAGTGTAYRSSIWIWGDSGHYLHFSQNVGENGWQYNWNDQGGLGGNPIGVGVNIDVLDRLDSDTGPHGMMLVFNPLGDSPTHVMIEMYLDNQLIASQEFTNWTPQQFYVMITGQARASGDTVTAIFDNVWVWVPEPSSYVLAGIGLGLFGLVALRRKNRGTV